MAKTAIHVTAGVMLDDAHRVLVSQRPVGKSMAGSWEFPGGKLLHGEGRLDGLVREFEEELGIHVEAARPLIRYRHRYPELEVDLDAWRVTSWRGTPRSLEGQAIAWQPSDTLLEIGLLPADEAIVRAIRLPAMIALTPPSASPGTKSFPRMKERLRGGLLCLRRPGLDAQALLLLAADLSSQIGITGTGLLLHGDPEALAPLIVDPPSSLRARLGDAIAGLHVPARYLSGMQERPVPRSYWFGVSCHDARELEAALNLNADYAFLGPLKPTTSHPGGPSLGWEAFEALVGGLPLPVYAIGGLGPQDLETAWAAGAQGIAGIRTFWPEFAP